MTSMDTNIDNYTITELLAILNLDDPNSDEIIDTTNKYIERYSPSNENQPKLVNFFQSMQTKLLRYMDQLETSGKDAEYAPNEKQTNDWFKYESLPQDSIKQKEKITDRFQKIDVYDNQHVPMKREQLGINNSYNLRVAQDSLNPNLQNTTSRFINIDSQFRQPSGGSEALSTDFTLDLSDPLTNVLSMYLYSIQVPYTWYTIDYIYGNTCFWVTNAGNTFKIFIEPGNYNPTEFCLALNYAFTNSTNFQKPYDVNDWPKGFTYKDNLNIPNIAKYNQNNGKITLYLDDWIDPANNQIKALAKNLEVFDSEIYAYYTFFDLTGTKSCYESGSYPCSASSGQGHTFNGTLGWLMGFRLPIEPVFTSKITKNSDLTLNYNLGNQAVAVLNLYGPKYFILVLDDYNQNHINNGLITITQLSKSLPLPSYYNLSQPYICTTGGLPPQLNINTLGNFAALDNGAASILGLNVDNLFNNLGDKLDISRTKIEQILPSAPRTLTQAQIYTANEIIKNRSKTISFRSKAPTNSDTFCLIPIKYSGMKTGDIYVDFSGSLQDNKRIYFGPVDIDRLHIKLLDDKGNIVDLHGADWSITIISENLYQY
uniref:Uncharacterized protein n=1 Tax=viral metagenome TaxID=1070528 RepID=A0A6C0KSA0_9ZZZZ